MDSSPLQPAAAAVWTSRPATPGPGTDAGRVLPKGSLAQREFFFGKERREKARFVIYPDPNGHNVFDELELFLAKGDDGKIATRWSKEDVLSTLALIYRRIESFLETTQNKGFADPWQTWYITFEKKTEHELKASSAGWWSSIRSTAGDNERLQLDAKNRQRFACAGWSSQLRIVACSPRKQAFKAIADCRKRDLLRSQSANRIPLLPTGRSEREQRLRVHTDAGDHFEFVDEWTQTEDVFYAIQRPSPISARFTWRWGIHDANEPFSVLARAPIASFARRFKPCSTRFGRGPTPTISFSQPYGIDVVFEEEKPAGSRRRGGPTHIHTGPDYGV